MPTGTYIAERLSAVSSAANHLQSVGEPGRRSRTTSKTAPRVQRPIFTSSSGVARKASALFRGTHVDRVFEKIGLHAAVVEERVALRRRAVTDDAEPALLRIDEEREQRPLRPRDAFAEAAVRLDPVEAGRPLRGE